MANTFEYRRIGQAFHNELADLINRRESAVLLGLRSTGKRYVLHTLAERQGNGNLTIVIRVEISHQPSLGSFQEVQKAINAAVREAAPGFTLKPAEDGELLNAVRQLCDGQHRSVLMLASNVDSMAHHLAQRILREARVLVQNHRLTAVLTGEENLALLVYGPESEFNCAQQFVIQGFDEPEFLDYMQNRKEIAIVPAGDRESFLRQLFLQTDGNIFLTRAVLWAWQDNQSRIRGSENKPVGVDEFSSFVRQLPVFYDCGANVLTHPARMVARSPDALKDLEALLHGGSVDVSPSTQPHSLELAGLATRDGGRLRFASPIMQRFAEGHFDDCRFGDLYAVQGDWDTAFRFYERMPAERRLRPGGVADRTRLALVIKALAAKLHSGATQEGEASLEKLEMVKRLFAKGCQMLLGPSEVTFWTYCGDWKPLDGQVVDGAVSNLARLILRTANRDKFGWQEVPPPLSHLAVLAVLPSVRGDCRDAVILSYVNEPVAISRERQEFHRELLDQFASAYHHTIANVGVKMRLEARQEHLAIATAIVNALGGTVRNPREALTLAGQQLLKLGYRRIMFALVDPSRKRIRGITDSVGARPTADVAAETDFDLSQPDKDIQPWVVVHKQSCVVDDWRTWEQRRGSWPSVNVGLCERAGHRQSFAVIPMLTKGWGPGSPLQEEVFGTIHVEREDGLPPSTDDIADLLEFGQQMAAAANQSERVHALLQTLNCNQDSVLILDHDENVRFVNRQASRLLELPEGWHDAHASLRLDKPQHKDLSDDANTVIRNRKRKVRHYALTNSGESRREAILCEPLPDWRVEENLTSTIGAVLQIRDLTPLHHVFSALQQVANHAVDSQTTTQALLSCVKDLGYASARLYRVDSHDSDLLVSAAALGLPVEFADRFTRGDYRMRRGDPESGETWWCIENAEPRVHQWNPERPTGQAEPTEKGLAIFNVQTPAFSHCWKEQGDAWIDLPLLATNQRKIGKLTIDCGKNFKCDLKPEDFELLKLFSALLGTLLDTLDKDKWLHDAADKAMATCAHNIRNKLAALDGFAERYRRAAPDNARVAELNQLHEPTVEECFRQVTRIKEAFSGMQLQRAPIRLKPLLQATFDGMFGKERNASKVSWELKCAESLEFSLDAERIRNTLEEMLANSLAMVPPGSRLELSVVAQRETRGSQQWLRLTLRDNGPGVPAEKRERIFEPFYSDRPYGKRSTGLGLNFVRRVVEAHNGRVWVTADSSRGAEFIIEIPSAKE